MAKCEFLFRDTPNVVPFREKLGNIIEGSGDFLVITSGYFQNLSSFKNNKDFFEAKFDIWFQKFSSNKAYMWLYGGQDSQRSEDDSSENWSYTGFKQLAFYFNQLCTRLAKKHKKNFSFTAGYSTVLFHSKISLKFDSSDYNTANKILIGSSNLTNKAFTIPEDNDDEYNFESDVYICRSSNEFFQTEEFEDFIVNNICNNPYISLENTKSLNTQTNPIFEIDDKTLEYIGYQVITKITNMRENNQFEILEL